MLYIISVSLLILGIAILFSVNDLNDKVKRIEAGQSKIQHKILNRLKILIFIKGSQLKMILLVVGYVRNIKKSRNY